MECISLREKHDEICWYETDSIGVFEPKEINRTSYLVEKPVSVYAFVSQRDQARLVFERYKVKWKEETKFVSSLHEKVLNENYLKIIALGNKAIPWILSELANDPDYWFEALRILANSDPVSQEDYGDFDKMTAAWLKWGRGDVFRLS